MRNSPIRKHVAAFLSAGLVTLGAASLFSNGLSGRQALGQENCCRSPGCGPGSYVRTDTGGSPSTVSAGDTVYNVVDGITVGDLSVSSLSLTDGMNGAQSSSTGVGIQTYNSAVTSAPGIGDSAGTSIGYSASFSVNWCGTGPACAQWITLTPEAQGQEFVSVNASATAGTTGIPGLNGNWASGNVSMDGNASNVFGGGGFSKGLSALVYYISAGTMGYSGDIGSAVSDSSSTQIGHYSQNVSGTVTGVNGWGPSGSAQYVITIGALSGCVEGYGASWSGDVSTYGAGQVFYPTSSSADSTIGWNCTSQTMSSD